MLTPSNTAMAPPKGWSVTLENLGPEIRDTNFSEFIRQVRVRLESNKADHHGWREEVLHLMCTQRPDIPCEDTALPSRVVTGDDMRRFVRTIYETWKQGAQPVSIEEQERRAAICRACPKRGYVSCFGGCGAIAEAISELVIGTQAKVFPELNKTACMACGCEISTMILFPLDVIHAVDERTAFQPDQYHEKCWKRPENRLPSDQGGDVSASPTGASAP
jgi:hypothetical protein